MPEPGLLTSTPSNILSARACRPSARERAIGSPKAFARTGQMFHSGSGGSGSLEVLSADACERVSYAKKLDKRAVALATGTVSLQSVPMSASTNRHSKQMLHKRLKLTTGGDVLSDALSSSILSP